MTNTSFTLIAGIYPASIIARPYMNKDILYFGVDLG
jgi:hypothetical protein